MALVTKQSVFDAANALKDKGQKPTIDAIRKALGGGSFSPISELLKEWRAGEAASQAAAPMIDQAPAALQERFGAVLASAWADALALANDRLESERRALATTREALEADKADAIAFANSLEADLEAAQLTIRQLTDAAAAAEKKHADQLATLAADAAQLREMLDQVEADHQATTAAKTELAKALGDTRKQQESAQADVARLAGELAAAQAREKSADEKREKAEKGLDQELRRLLVKASAQCRPRRAASLAPTAKPRTPPTRLPRGPRASRGGKPEA